MRGSVLISFLGISMTMAGLVGGCGDADDTDTDTAPPEAEKSGVGESCLSRDDCSGDLLCVSQVCVTDPNASGGTGGTGGGVGEAGSGGTGGKGGLSGGTGGMIVGPDLGGEGETCSRSADCAPNLGCFNQRCAAAPIGEGGGGNIPVLPLGGVGETCVLSSDCDAGLSCQPSGANGAVGVCTPSETGITPTGMSCGAECKTAEDCCELPRELHATIAESCAELDALLGTTDCADPGALSSLCFAKQVYCDCSAGEDWACTNGACSYTGECTVDGLMMDGCPTTSRSGNPLWSICDVDTSECQPVPGTAFCDEDTDCDTLYVTDIASDVCEPGECTCYQGSACYRKCDEDLDCAAGKVCDTAEAVCVPADSCSNDTTCQARLGDFRATCDSGVCTIPCEVDLDCNPGGLVDLGLVQVCEAGRCQAIGCAADSECAHQGDLANIDPVVAASPRQMFCTTPTPGSFTRPGSSAITD